MTHSLFNVGLKRVVSRDAGRGVGLRFRGVPDEWNAKVSISAFEGLQVGPSVGQTRRCEGGGVGDDRVAVGIVLLKRSALPDRRGGRGDLGLVERQRNDFMAADISDVAD